MTTPSSTTLTDSRDEGLQSDVRLPSAEDWHSSAPKRVERAYAEGDSGEGWRVWTDYLGDRKKPAGLRSLLKVKYPPLLWSLPKDPPDDQTQRLVKLLDKLTKRDSACGQEAVDLLVPWLDESSDATIDAPHAIQCVAWARSLTRLSQHCPDDLWWELTDHLVGVAVAASEIDAARDPLAANLLIGELPLTLAYSLPELKSCRRLAKKATEFLSNALDELLDGQGMPHARNLHLLRPLLGCWTRCASILNKLPKSDWTDDADRQYAWLVTQALRMTRPDSPSLLPDNRFDPPARELLDTAVTLGGDDADEEITDLCLPGRSPDHDPEMKWPGPAYESEWSELAVLRSSWETSSNQLTLTYPDGKTNIELCRGKDVLLSGEWSFELTLADRKLTLDADATWEAMAWESDNDVDYIELEISVTPELRVQRSLLLARNDNFLLLADAVLGDDPRSLLYRSQLPLAIGVTATAEDESREICLASGKSRARVLPLALPEWRTDPRWGSLEAGDRKLVLEQTGKESLFAPIFIDLEPRRQKKPLTWRQLSIGESCKNLPRHVAGGYRAQIGNTQWLIYRSLTPAANRTVLGQNLMCEMHVSRFLRDGEVEELIEIE